jgi:hypothetical protein
MASASATASATGSAGAGTVASGTTTAKATSGTMGLEISKVTVVSAVSVMFCGMFGFLWV